MVSDIFMIMRIISKKYIRIRVVIDIIICIQIKFI